MQIFKKEKLNTFGSWDSVCVSMSKSTSGEIINGKLEFTATRGHSVSDDIEVDAVELVGYKCPRKFISSPDLQGHMNY